MNLKNISSFFKKRRGFLILAAAILILNTTLQNYMDDFDYTGSFEKHNGFLNWAIYYGTTWSGRIIPHGIMIFLLSLPNFVFVIANSVMQFLLVYMVGKTLASKRWNRLCWMPPAVGAFLFLIIPADIIKEPLFWKSALVLYSWGIVGTLAALYPFIRQLQDRKIKKSDYVFAFIGCLYSSGFEQISLFMMTAATLFTLYQFIIRHRFKIACLLLNVFIVSLSLFFICIPGNKTRNYIETVMHFPAFSTFSLYDKALWGISFSLNAANEGIYILFFIALAVYIILRNRKTAVSLKIMSAWTLFYYSLELLNNWCLNRTVSGNENDILRNLFTFIQVDSTQFVFPQMESVMTVIAFCTFGILGYLLYFTGVKGKDPVAPVFFFGGFCTAMIVPFSASIYASGYRTKFLFLEFLAFVFLRTVYLLFQEVRKPVALRKVLEADVKNPEEE
ncbi:MAG TPA: DUF6056 family protein [Lachnospiraceae bacterium]|nr:DUF6056 family protein [Lachnospiraceae bacterium]